jgi:hypothetical protein
LLAEIDYLSTVSGGGYIGAWFTSWIKRSTLSEVIVALSKGRNGEFDPEPAPVSFLREYSNYLNPQLGVTSADTWALAGTYLRNVLLNWVVLLPLIGCVLLLPRIMEAALAYLATPGGESVCEQFWALADALASAAFAFLCIALPATEVDNPRQSRFLWFGLLPASLAAICFSVYIRLQPNPARDISRHWVLSLTPIILAAAIVAIYGRARRGAIDLRWIASGVLAVGLSVVIGAAITLRLIDFLPDTWTPSSMHLFVVLAVPIVLLLLFVGIAILVGLSSKVTGDEDREWLARAGGWILVVASVWLLLSSIAIYGPEFVSLLGTASTSMVAGWALSQLGKSSTSRVATKPKIGLESLPAPLMRREIGIRILLPIFTVILLMTLSKANDELVSSVKKLLPAGVPAVVSVLALVVLELLISALAAVFINVNKFSLHGMYRLRLIRAYLGASRLDRSPNYFTGFDPDDNVYLRALRQRPFHVVNIALNLVKGKRLSWQQRKAASFTATPLHAGSLWWGYRPIKEYSDAKLGMSLGGAITISGAAASPNMGYHSSPLLTIVMTLFNARLGAWLGNPGKHGSQSWMRNGPLFGWRSYVDELFGLTNEDNHWVYLSDGGHFENLGVYEMVLRRCRTIIAVDASCDQHYEFEDLANAVRKIRIDLGVPIEFPGGVEIGPATEKKRHWVIGRIRYSAVDGTAENEDGRLIYIKPSLTGDEPADITQYHRSNPAFPHESTTEQWFSESQFESYRALGHHIALEIIGSGRSAGLEQFVSRASDKRSRAEPLVKC